MTDRFRLFWGKAQPGAGAGVQWHPNAWHGLDVAAVAGALLEGGVCRPPVGWRDPAMRPSLLALIALHDIGKYSRPFQAKAPAAWPDFLLRDAHIVCMMRIAFVVLV